MSDKHQEAIRDLQRFIAIASGQDPDTFEMRGITKEEAEAHRKLLDGLSVKHKRLYEL